MKVVRNVIMVALLAAAPFALAHREEAGQGCQGAQAQGQGMQERHAERQARMSAMHQGVQYGMNQGMQGFGPRFGQAQKQDQDKK